MTPPPTAMLETLRPLLDALGAPGGASDLDLADPAATERRLTELLDPAGPAAAELSRGLVGLLEAGRIAQRGELPVRWGRIAKPGAETCGFSIDAVHMNGAGPRHRHPTGEIDYAIALDGEPRFDARPAGWIVYAPDSVHTPTVTGGSMLIVYFLPGGAIEFLE